MIALPPLLFMLGLSGCALWIDESDLPEFTPSGVGEGDSGDSGDTGSPCSGVTVSLYAGPSNQGVWAGQWIHVHSEPALSPSELSVTVTPFAGDGRVLEPDLLPVAFGDSGAAVYVPPAGGWPAQMSHEVAATWGDDCSVTVPMQVGGLGSPPTQQLYGEQTYSGDLSRGTVFPKSLGLDPSLFESGVGLRHEEQWEPGSPPSTAVSFGLRGNERHPCSSASRHAPLGSPGVSLRVPMERIAIDVDGEPRVSAHGEVVVALGATVVHMPRIELWLDVDAMGGQAACDHTLCESCWLGRTCGLVILEDVPAQSVTTDVLPSDLNCFPSGSGECQGYCEPV